MKTYYKAIVIKTLRFWCKNRQTNKESVNHSPQTEPHVHDKGNTAEHWGKDKLFQ